MFSFHWKMESGCLTAWTPLAEPSELWGAERAWQPLAPSAPKPGRSLTSLCLCPPGTGTAQHLLPVSHTFDRISRQRKMRGGKDREKGSKESKEKKKKTVEEKWGSWFKPEEGWEIKRLDLVAPHPPGKGWRKRRERRWRDGTRARAYLHAQGAYMYGHAWRARHVAEKAIPQSGVATEAPAQWYPFVKAVAIKGP